MASRKTLITGISGFVGPYLARKLLDMGYQVAGLVPRRADGERPKRLRELGILSEVDIVNTDVTDLTSMLSAVEHVQPDWIFHLAAQSYVPQSFKDPLETFRINCLGTHNLLEAVRLKGLKIRMIFAGSSEEYGLQFKDHKHFESMQHKYGVIEPLPARMPEIPVNEQSYLRPMSPYATSKVFGDYIFRNYHKAFELDTVVSRAFNHEGAGRGHNFVTSVIVRQLVSMHLGEQEILRIGDIQAFRDWSHVEDIVDGYVRIAEKAGSGSVYVQGSMRSNSVLSYILYTISALGYEINQIHSFKNNKTVKDPLEKRKAKLGESAFDSNAVDELLLSNNLEYEISDEGIVVETTKRNFKVQFDQSRFRPSDVPILMADTAKIKMLGIMPKKGLDDIISDQINYYLDHEHRSGSMQE